MSTLKRKQTWLSTKVPNLLKLKESGTYYFRIKPKNGKRFRVSLETKEFAVAKERVRQRLVELQANRSASGSTFGSVLEPYKDDLAAKKSRGDLTESSVLYKIECIDQIQETWKDFQLQVLSECTEGMLSNWVTKHRTQYSATRTNGAVTVIREMLNIAVRDKVLARELSDEMKHGLKFVEVDYDYKRQNLQLPEPQQVDALRNEVYRRCTSRGTQGAFLFDLLLFSGIRHESAEFVLWKDVHKDKGFIFISKAKTGSYTVPLFRELLGLVERLEKAFPHHKPTDRLVPTKSLQSVLTSACRALTLPHLSHHDLRHIFAIRCIESGVDIPTVAGWLGHKDGGALAMEVYGHLRKSHSDKQAQQVSFLAKPNEENPQSPIPVADSGRSAEPTKSFSQGGATATRGSDAPQLERKEGAGSNTQLESPT